MVTQNTFHFEPTFRNVVVSENSNIVSVQKNVNWWTVGLGVALTLLSLFAVVANKEGADQPLSESGTCAIIKGF